MAGRILPGILDLEGNAFKAVDRVWRPIKLIVEPYRRNMLRDIRLRYTRVEQAIDEFQELPKADVYIRLLTRMRLLLKRAEISWRADDLAFLQAVSGFYTSYGAMLRLLQDDRARGRLSSPLRNKGRLTP